MTAMPRALRHLALTVLMWTAFRMVSLAYFGFEGPNVPMLPHSATQFAVASIEEEPSSVASVVRLARQEPESRRQIGNADEIEALQVPEEILDVRNDPAPMSGAPEARVAAIMLWPDAAAPGLGKRRPRPDNLSLSAWSIYRPDSGALGLAPAGQLGGSQLGFRIQHRLLEPVKAVTVSANVRVSSPLRLSHGNEAGLGIAFRRTGKVPIELIAERRIGLDRGGRDAFAGLVATGISDLPVVAKFRLNGYAQAGIVGVRKRDGFADGSMLLARSLKSVGPIAIEAGGGVWGAVQPGVSRLDLGPSVAARFRLGNASVRLGGEWRHRVAGNARPGSGPVITFGLDY